MCIVTDHAILRYRERVAPIEADAALDAIMAASNAIDLAASFGCNLVKLGNGARLRLSGDVVVTALPKRGH